MTSTERIAQALYVSRMAPDCDSTVVKDIVAVARRHNPAHGITGALMFDGERFSQLIEGPAEAIHELMQRITQDPRHTDLRVLFNGFATAGRLASRWRCGYCEPASFDVFDAVHGSHGAAALDAFNRLLPLADLD